MFKVGDIVKRTCDSAWPDEYGYTDREYTVLAVDPSNTGIRINPDGPWCISCYFELVKPYKISNQNYYDYVNKQYNDMLINGTGTLKIEVNDKKHKCHCHIVDIMKRGCNCGGQ